MKRERGYRAAAAYRMRSPQAQEDFQPEEVDLEPMGVQDQDQAMQADAESNANAASELGAMYGAVKKAPKKR